MTAKLCLAYAIAALFLALPKNIPAPYEGFFVSAVTIALGVWAAVVWVREDGNRRLALRKLLWLFYCWLLAYATERFFAEALGAAYSEQLQPNLGRVPIAMPFGWVAAAILVGVVAAKATVPMPTLARSFVGAGAITALDWVAEAAGQRLGHRTWEGGEAPSEQYVATFLVASILLFLANRMRLFAAKSKPKQAMVESSHD